MDHLSSGSIWSVGRFLLVGFLRCGSSVSVREGCHYLLEFVGGKEQSCF